jgi:hypothetical protein
MFNLKRSTPICDKKLLQLMSFYSCLFIFSNQNVAQTYVETELLVYQTTPPMVINVNVLQDFLALRVTNR